MFAAGLDRGPLRELHLLTAKPFLYVFNLDEDELTDDALRAELAALVAPAEAVFLDAKVEAELIEMDDDEALELLQSMGQSESGLHQLARIGFDTLGLQTYLTAGPKEARAWTIKKGATAPEAAGVIHSDFQRGFIKAEVIAFDDLVDRRLDAGRPRRRQGAHGGQGLRHAGRRRRGVPLQRVERRKPAGQGPAAECGGSQLHLVAEVRIESAEPRRPSWPGGGAGDDAPDVHRRVGMVAVHDGPGVQQGAQLLVQRDPVGDVPLHTRVTPPGRCGAEGRVVRAAGRVRPRWSTPAC